MTTERSEHTRHEAHHAPLPAFGDPTPGPHSSVASATHTAQLVGLDVVLSALSALLGLVIVASISIRSSQVPSAGSVVPSA